MDCNTLEHVSAKGQELLRSLQNNLAALNPFQVSLHQSPGRFVAWCKRRWQGRRWLWQQCRLFTAPASCQPEQERLTTQPGQSDPAQPVTFVEPQRAADAKDQ